MSSTRLHVSVVYCLRVSLKFELISEMSAEILTVMITDLNAEMSTEIPTVMLIVPNAEMLAEPLTEFIAEMIAELS